MNNNINHQSNGERDEHDGSIIIIDSYSPDESSTHSSSIESEMQARRVKRINEMRLFFECQDRFYEEYEVIWRQRRQLRSIQQLAEDTLTGYNRRRQAIRATRREAEATVDRCNMELNLLEQQLRTVSIWN